MNAPFWGKYMDAYRFSLYLGFTGMVSMAALSFLGQMGHAHGGSQGTSHGGSHGGHGHAGHAHGHGNGHNGHAHGHQSAATQHSSHASHNAAHQHGHHAHHSGGLRFQASQVFMLLLSPRLWFSILLGFGATGILIKGLMLGEPWRALLAVAGGLCFEKFLFGPLWNFWFCFAGEGHTLESAVAEEARAVTNFDATGCGLIALNLDGQTIQLLGRLSARERAEGIRVRTGDILLVEAVDAQRQSCTVSSLKQL